MRITLVPHRGATRRSKVRRLTVDPNRIRRTIVHLTAEYYPYARTGGLAEAVAGLATYQARAGATVVVFVPLYPTVREVAPDLESIAPPQRVALGRRLEDVRYFRDARAVRGDPTVLFIDAPGYFTRSGLYGEQGSDYPDNHRRFALFARAALEGAKRFLPGPVLFHAHDWHAALAPVYLRTYGSLREHFGPAPVVVSVHNAGYQGHFPRSAMEDMGLPWDLWDLEHLEWYGHLNVLKGGLTFCDMAVTVSPSHARELCTPEGGFGLHHTFTQLGSRLVGICNGIDQSAWDPATDPHLVANYSRDDLAGKARCKDALQRSFGLARRRDVPLIAMSARLVKQKGFDIILASDRVRSGDAQFVFLGMGDPGYHEALSRLVRECPRQVAVEFGFTDLLEHKVVAGADLLMMPSLYEPCGLTQMRAQRYGVPVIGRSVGGIRDTVEDGVTGFLFDTFDVAALDRAIERATVAFADHPRWTALMRSAMVRDFGWERPAREYAATYRTAARVAFTPSEAMMAP